MFLDLLQVPLAPGLALLLFGGPLLLTGLPTVGGLQVQLRQPCGEALRVAAEPAGVQLGPLLRALAERVLIFA